MIAHHKGAEAPSSASPVFLKMNEVCERFRVHPNTVRAATANGKLRCFRLNGLSHRRFKEADILEWLGCESREVSPEGTIPIALVGRVSGYAQAKDRKTKPEGSEDAKGDLGRQVGRIKEWIKEKYGERAQITEYVRIASGLNLEHPTLLRLLRDIMAGKFSGGKVICENKERLARWSWPLWEEICKQYNTQLVIMARSEETTAEDELMSDLLSLTHVFSSKLYARRSASRSRVREIVNSCGWWLLD